MERRDTKLERATDEEGALVVEAGAGGRRRRARKPVTGPHAGMPLTAQRLLEASRRILETSGYARLSFTAIERESGENKALIKYYFGSKAGLVIALVEWLVHEQLTDMRAMFAALPEGEGRIHALAEGNLRMVRDVPAYQLYFELVPNLLRDPNMRSQLAGYYATCRQLNLWGLHDPDDGEPGREAITLAAMTMALADGIALQMLADPLSVDSEMAWQLWEEFVTHKLLQAAARQPAGA